MLMHHARPRRCQQYLVLARPADLQLPSAVLTAAVLRVLSLHAGAGAVCAYVHGRLAPGVHALPRRTGPRARRLRAQRPCNASHACRRSRARTRPVPWAARVPDYTEHARMHKN